MIVPYIPIYTTQYTKYHQIHHRVTTKVPP